MTTCPKKNGLFSPLQVPTNEPAHGLTVYNNVFYYLREMLVKMVQIFAKKCLRGRASDYASELASYVQDPESFKFDAIYAHGKRMYDQRRYTINF